MTKNIIFDMLTPAIGQLTLSQPARRNALNAKMWADLPKILNKATKTKSLRALIVTGDGDHFASGADISEFETLYATASRAKFAITPAKLGLVYPFSDVQRLIETVGIPHAKDILLSARLIQAKPARKMGLINQLFKVDNLEDKTLEYAQGLTSLSPQSLKVTKQMFAAYQAGQSSETEQSMDWFLDGFSSKDFKKGYKAFLAMTDKTQSNIINGFFSRSPAAAIISFGLSSPNPDIVDKKLKSPVTSPIPINMIT